MHRAWEAPVQLVVNPADATSHPLIQLPRTPPRYEHARLAQGEQVPFDWLPQGWFEQAVAAYQRVKTQHPDEAAVQGAPLNQVGYQLLRKTQTAQALRIFTLATLLYPRSNAFDSLAEAYLHSGNREQALANYARWPWFPE